MHLFKSVGLVLMVVGLGIAHAAAPNVSQAPAKQEDVAKGYAFFTNHDEIVTKAKKEGKLRVSANLERSTIKATTAAFKKKYPFLEDVYVAETTGTEAAQRMLLALKSGAAEEWDTTHILVAFRSDYSPHLWNVDLLGMAKRGVLQIPPSMIDQKNRNVVALCSYFQPTAYNVQLVAPDLVPKTWEDLLRPELKNRKFALDIRPKDVAALVPVWGLEKTLDFARKLAAQQPIWVRGSRALTSMVAGEIPMVVGPNIASVKLTQLKDRTGVARYVIPEPVPVRFGSAQGILASSQHRHAALLWMEWMTSPEAQKIVDETEFSSSVHVRGGFVEQELRAKKLSVVDWEHYHDVERWEEEVSKAYGFPKVDAKK
jgi:ABC-type Fe3+ transport system substrate-binding protein